MENKPALIELATQIVAAYVTKNPVEQADLPKLITEVHRALEKASAAPVPSTAAPAERKPAVNIKRSITPDYLVCLEDGKKFKSLKRHLRPHFNLTPEQYREKWGFRRITPMAAPELRHLALEAREEHGPRATSAKNDLTFFAWLTFADQPFTIYKRFIERGIHFAKGGVDHGVSQHSVQGTARVF